jgi:ABC-type lipoprotein release transport system permease subunit
MTTTYDAVGSVVKYNDQVFNEIVHFSDEHFFDFFDFKTLSGKADLSNRNAVIITEEIAKKYFGNTDPVGQSLLFFADTDIKFPLLISAVVETPRMNSSIRFGFLIHHDNQPDEAGKANYTHWTEMLTAVFLKTRPGVDIKALSAKLQPIAALNNSARPDWAVTAFHATPLLEVADNSHLLRSNGLWMRIPAAAVWGNIALTLMLLLTAALNFSNMTISVCNRRLREMCMRKVMGGTRRQLMVQILSETAVVVVLAIGFGIFLSYPLCDWFNALWKFTDFQPDYSDPKLLLYVACIMLGATLLAGSYPAFYISSFRPSSVFRSGALFGNKNLFSRILMGLQISISIITVVAGLSFARNAAFNRTADIGFAYQNILQAWVPRSYPLFLNAVRDIPGVDAVAGTVHLPGFGYQQAEFLFQGNNYESALYHVGNDFLKTMEFHLKSGDYPIPSSDTSFSTEVVVNERFANEIAGGKDPIGEVITWPGSKTTLRIAGVLKDFMTNTPFAPIRPCIVWQVPQWMNARCMIKTSSPAQNKPVLAAIEAKWKMMFPYTPFNVGYQNEMMMEATEASDNIARSMGMISIITVLLGCIGLFSIISLDVLRRMREVAVRRVMGASAANITWVLNRNLLAILAFSVITGCFFGWFFTKKLMDSIFYFNVGIHPSTILAGALGVLLITSVTIGLKVWRTLQINPATVLRND